VSIGQLRQSLIFIVVQQFVLCTTVVDGSSGCIGVTNPMLMATMHNRRRPAIFIGDILSQTMLFERGFCELRGFCNRRAAQIFVWHRCVI
jgi:hypothetical protein